MADNFTARKFAWLEAVARDCDLRNSAVRLAIILSGFFNRESGDAWPSVELLGRETGLSRRGVQYALDDLMVKGHLGREIGGGRPARDSDRKTTSLYFMREKQRTGVHGNGHKQRTGVPDL